MIQKDNLKCQAGPPPTARQCAAPALPQYQPGTDPKPVSGSPWCCASTPTLELKGLHFYFHSAKVLGSLLISGRVEDPHASRALGL
jgi:hypothetical protein